MTNNATARVYVGTYAKYNSAYARDCSFDGMTFARHGGDVWVFRP